jgi:hypothetical protein
MPLTLPVDANCLHCHVSGVATALPGARNHLRALRLRMEESGALPAMAMQKSICGQKARRRC